MKKIKNILGATINNIIVAFIFIVIICVTIRFTIGDELMQAIALINLVSVSDKNNNTENEAIKIDLENKNLTHYPAWGEKYGTLSIDSINVKLGLYYGDSLSILRKGVGQILTNGGRVMAVSSFGTQMEQALKQSYANVARLSFKDMSYRRDIGQDLIEVKGKKLEAIS